VRRDWVDPKRAALISGATSSTNRRWRPALIGAGLAGDRYVFHSCRHFCASSMLAEGVNPMAVAGHLGDTLESLQRVYAHWLRDDRDVPADALDRILAIDAEKSADFSRTADRGPRRGLTSCLLPGQRHAWWRVGLYAGFCYSRSLNRRDAP